MLNINKKILITTLLTLGCTNVAQAGFFSKKCNSPNGTLRIVEPEDVSAWTGIGLSAPTKILRVFVNDSKCFTIVDRGAAFTAAQLERNLANSGLFQSGQNLGNGQMKAADFVLVPDLISQNLDAGGGNMNVGGSKSGLLGFGSGKASRTTQKKSAEVVLTLIDVRTSEQISSATAKAVIKDSMNVVQLQGNVPAASVNGQVGFSNYSNTPIGQAIMLAYEDAYDNLIKDIEKKQIYLRKDSAPQATDMVYAQQPQYNMNQQLVAPQQQVNYAPVATQQAAYPLQANYQPVVTQQIQHQQPIEATHAQVQNIYVNQQIQTATDHQQSQSFSRQEMMQEVENTQRDVHHLQKQAQTTHPVALLSNPLAAIAQVIQPNAIPQQAVQQNSVAQQAVQAIDQSTANLAPVNTQTVSSVASQASTPITSTGDAVIDFLTRYKTADATEVNRLIDGLSALSPATLSMLKKPSLNKDKIILTMMGKLADSNPTLRGVVLKTLNSLSDQQVSSLIETYRSMVNPN